MDYDTWLKEVPQTITGDALWSAEVYRLSLFVADLTWRDATKLWSDKRTLRLSDQLFDGVCSIGANIAEGYSRGSNKDRARFYEYALGSARESRNWYYKGRHILGHAVLDHRLRLLTQIIRLLLTIIPQQRGYALHETHEDYSFAAVDSQSPDAKELLQLLQTIPIP